MHRLAKHPLVALVLGFTDFALGVVLITEPDMRVSSVSFSAAKQVMPMKAWGLILLILACAIVVRSLSNLHAGYALSLAGAWHTFFVVSLIASATQNPTAALTGIVSYSGYAVTMHLLAAWRKIR